MEDKELILDRGITGCWGLGDEPSLENDFRTFHSHCFEVARQKRGRLLSIASPNPAGHHRNYSLGTMEIRSEIVCVVLNAHYSIVAFAAPVAESEVQLLFRDNLELAQAFGVFGLYQIALAHELGQPPTPKALLTLSPAEQKQVKYWNPQRIGDIIFNSWD
jgi:hypothetical protein